jgi:uncharacterized Fe-S center protein
MPGKVYFVNLRARSPKQNKISKIKQLYEAAGFDALVLEKELTAIKLHFGERGNDSYINPVFVRQVVDKLKAKGAKPFLTDTNTLYSGSRHNAVDHLVTALEHGFGFSVTGAPIIIADGLRGGNVAEVSIYKKHFETVKLAQDIVSANSMIVMSHFKGHEMAGFGGAIKNMAMGGAPAAGKKEQHSVSILVNQENCIGCTRCAPICPEEAIAVTDKKAFIAPEKCIGCGECMTVCPVKAIGMNWGAETTGFMEKMTEYAYGVVQSFQGKIGYLNFLTNITPDCDCVPWSDAPIVPDIGFLASADPVAIDQASYDLVNQQIGLTASLLTKGHASGEDKFHHLHPRTKSLIQLEYGEEIGLGSRAYELIEL